MQSLIILAFLVFQVAGRVKVSGLPSPEIRVSLEKIYIFGILVERAINSLNFV